HGAYVDYMENLLSLYQIKKAEKIIVGGSDRQRSLLCGLDTIMKCGGNPEDIVVIHDGVRPLVNVNTISENIRVAKQYGCAITVHSVTESVVITESEDARMADFKKRADTYSMTAPQTFRLGNIRDAYHKVDLTKDGDIPLLDAAMVYAQAGGEAHLVKEQGVNLKITTPEDFYYLKALLELEEHKYIFGL
ncbi:MAG: 2-C-methyl-D-erythritol 4-phosphate cytidylyltransferase, partial [Lachnospiraceae bacterium]|nr:2-C-methyl-D-erythritol 4-phosphate cytidylyltransferase [Lachnospiraceae bacterium]